MIIVSKHSTDNDQIPEISSHKAYESIFNRTGEYIFDQFYLLSWRILRDVYNLYVFVYAIHQGIYCC